jgi:transcriptional regulator with XRE-family HTH domain
VSSASTDIAADLGARLLSIRLAASLTQEEVAAEIGVPVRSYQDYEAGKAWPRPKRRRQILAWIAQRTTATEAVA